MTAIEITTLLEDAEALLGGDNLQVTLDKTANALVDALIQIDTSEDSETANTHSHVVSTLEKLSDEGAIQSGWLTATLHYIKGDYSRYLKSIEPVIATMLCKSNPITTEEAYHNFIEIFDNISVNDDFDFYGFFRKFHAVLARQCPGTAFELYIKLWISKTKNPNIQEKHLLYILGIDPGWAAAHADLGDLYSSEKNWKAAVTHYLAAIAATDLYKSTHIYFKLAWANGALKEYTQEEQYYRLCLETDSDYLNANNNLGWSLIKQKRYVESLPYFDREIALSPGDKIPYRNKFDALLRLGYNEELLALITANPVHFKTKYYQTKIKGLSGGNDVSNLLEQLKATTESDNAGKFEVSGANSNIQLYEHQRDAIRVMSRRILSADAFAGLLVLPTGGGKTLTATYWLMQETLDKGGKIIWLAHRHELLNQARGSFEKVCYHDITKNQSSYRWRVISGQHDKPVHIKPTDDIIIGSKTSLYRGLHHLDTWLNVNHGNVFLIIDEAHHSTASEYRKLIENIKLSVGKFRMLGLTATPFRTADSEQGLLKKLYPDDIVYKIDLRELINRGILSEPIFKSVPTGIDMAALFAEHNAEGVLARIATDSFFDIDTIGEDTARAIAENNERNSAIVNEYVKNRDIYKKTLVFALNVNMAIVLTALFKAHGVKADFVVSSVRDIVTGVTISDEENEEKIRLFRGENLSEAEQERELDVLINVNILTEGTDLPQVQSVFLTRPTKSTILMTQMIGRALRGEKAGGTKDAYIVSFIDNWQDYIAWVNPEQLFIDENVDFTENTPQTQKSALRLVSIEKMEEFAKLANDTLDPAVAGLEFIDRIPVGIYQFTYLVEATTDDEDDAEKHCNILVYDCMTDAYAQFLAWLPGAEITDVYEAADYVDATLFGATDLLLGYSKQDIVDIIRFYQQNEQLPEMIKLTERGEYDISVVAAYILEHPTQKREHVESEWNRADSRWKAFFGIENYMAFRKAVNNALDRLEYPDDYAPPSKKPLTTKEIIQIEDLPLYEIRRRFPELGEKLVAAVYKRFTDDDGYYYSANSGFRSRSKLDFQIDHIIPMSAGGKTVPDNLQLLTRAENMIKSDSVAGG